MLLRIFSNLILNSLISVMQPKSVLIVNARNLQFSTKKCCLDSVELLFAIIYFLQMCFAT